MSNFTLVNAITHSLLVMSAPSKIAYIAYFPALIIVSSTPQKCGDSGGLNSHPSPWFAVDSMILFSSRCTVNWHNSLLAPMKFASLSDMNSFEADYCDLAYDKMNALKNESVHEPNSHIQMHCPRS